MKLRKLFTVSVCFIIVQSLSFAQLAESSWVLGIGGSYPRLISTTNKISDINYG